MMTATQSDRIYISLSDEYRETLESQPYLAGLAAGRQWLASLSPQDYATLAESLRTPGSWADHDALLDRLGAPPAPVFPADSLFEGGNWRHYLFVMDRK